MKINGKYTEITNPIEMKNEESQLWSRPITKDRLAKRQKLQQSAIAAYENIRFDRLA